MDKPRYTVEIVIAAPGTPLIDPGRASRPSTRRAFRRRPPRPHVLRPACTRRACEELWICPREHGSVNGPGTIMEDDATVYIRPALYPHARDQRRPVQEAPAVRIGPGEVRLQQALSGRAQQLRGLHLGSLEPRRHRAKRSIDVNALGGPAGQLLPDVRIPLDIKGQARMDSDRCATSMAWTALIRRFRTASSIRGKPIPCRSVVSSNTC